MSKLSYLRWLDILFTSRVTKVTVLMCKNTSISGQFFSFGDEKDDRLIWTERLN
jgi:hypothetical protein